MSCYFAVILKPVICGFITNPAFWDWRSKLGHQVCITGLGYSNIFLNSFEDRQTFLSDQEWFSSSVTWVLKEACERNLLGCETHRQMQPLCDHRTISHFSLTHWICMPLFCLPWVLSAVWHFSSSFCIMQCKVIRVLCCLICFSSLQPWPGNSHWPTVGIKCWGWGGS